MTKYDSHLEEQLSRVATSFKRIPSRQKPSCFEVIVKMGYSPDFKYEGEHHTVFIEAKGRLFDRNREILSHIPVEHRKNIKFVLQNPFMRYKSKGKASITQWLEKYGYEWCWIKDTRLPQRIKEWMKEADTGVYQ